ncbi:hypothetical protein GCM10010502_15480 [Kitasatospora aureofaciens]|uniref:Uncharacterized protein n=1 Tax=Kitasatospora aureofaciens TaxID=1894 RepID=A0A8H9LK52_KITAU|nr:hypothetical protein B6264_11935 [Kitasatospora aureofaciens]GGU65514.1 hypothetical protein GCM10010502_15480 [Kitasatospora aureofaciens]
MAFSVQVPAEVEEGLGAVAVAQAGDVAGDGAFAEAEAGGDGALGEAAGEQTADAGRGGVGALRWRSAGRWPGWAATVGRSAGARSSGRSRPPPRMAR